MIESLELFMLVVFLAGFFLGAIVERIVLMREYKARQEDLRRRMEKNAAYGKLGGRVVPFPRFKQPVLPPLADAHRDEDFTVYEVKPTCTCVPSLPIMADCPVHDGDSEPKGHADP